MIFTFDIIFYSSVYLYVYKFKNTYLKEDLNTYEKY